MTETRLYIGNRNYSSWSLRPWLVLRWAGIPFTEMVIPLHQAGYGTGGIQQVRAVSPTGQVPALEQGDLQLWDSLAISEWAAEQVAPGLLWPADPALRALARAVTAEMHAGFAAVRRDLPMNIQGRLQPQDWAEDTRRALARLDTLWQTMRDRFGQRGPWLLGERSIADAFYTPVATRLRSYGVDLSPASDRYRDTLLADPDFQDWEAGCEGNSWDRHGYSVIDALYPARSTAPNMARSTA